LTVIVSVAIISIVF